MIDPLITNWPTGNGRQVLEANGEVVDASLGLYRIVFQDSAGKRLNVQIPLGVLGSLVETAQVMLKR